METNIMALYTEVAKLSLPFLENGILETIITTDQFLALLPIQDVSPALQLMYNKESDLGGGITSASLIAPDGTFTPGSSSYTNVTQNLTFAGATFNLPIALSTDAAIARETFSKSKLVAREMGKLVVNALSTDASTNFNGIRYAYSGSATQDIPVAAVGSGSFSLAAVDQAIWAVKAGRPNLIVTSTAGYRYFKSALRTAAGGARTDMLQMENYGTPFLAYDGIPIVASDWIGTEDNGGTSAYVLYTNEVDGVKLWSNFGQLVQMVGPIPVIYSMSNNYTIGTGFGMVCPPLAGARIYGILS